MAEQPKTPAEAAQAGASDGNPPSPQGEQTAQARFSTILERLGATGDSWDDVKLDREPETPEGGTDKQPGDDKEPILPDAQKAGGADSDADELPTPTKVEDIPIHVHTEPAAVPLVRAAPPAPTRATPPSARRCGKWAASSRTPTRWAMASRICSSSSQIQDGSPR